ncbi:MAG: S8 family serine peptidase [Luteolibacter sp.]
MKIFHIVFILGVLSQAIVGAEIRMESLQGEGLWISPPPGKYQAGKPLRVTVWFDKQLLGDGKAYQRRAGEFSESGRLELREKVFTALKAESVKSFGAAKDALDGLVKEKLISDVERHWIVNGFSCTVAGDRVDELRKVPGVRKVFLRPVRVASKRDMPEMPEVTKLPKPEKPSFEDLPWYIEKLKADRVWKEFGIAGEGTLNVIHDGNFVPSGHLVRTMYRSTSEVPGNGIDDDGNGYIDDASGYNFDRNTAEIYTHPFDGDPQQRKILHGTSCATIVSGAGDGGAVPQFGVAPLSRWAGVINQGGIERSVEWAIDQGADTYSMSFSQRDLGEYQSHWRKVMEHGSFCGVFFISGAGNVQRGEEFPFSMNVPENIPGAVFAAAGVQRDLSKTSFSCVGPVEWNTEHYQDGVVQKPEVCAFNIDVPCLYPDGTVVPDLLRGNSFAGPMFCGAISLMLSADPDLLPWDLQEIITSTATDVGPPGLDYETGHGLIDCHAAVKEVLRRKALR